MARTYGQYCGLARALDVVGDRWNLLVVRQLLVAPARYGELLAGLPGMATNLLVDRLRDLEEAGVVERRAHEQGGTPTYALTPWGAALREPIEALIRWSTPLMTRGPQGDHFRAEWLAVALRALLQRRRPAGINPTIGLAVDGQVVQVRATSRTIEIAPHDGRPLDAVAHADPWVLLGVASGALSLDGAGIRVDGDREAVRLVFDRAVST